MSRTSWLVVPILALVSLAAMGQALNDPDTPIDHGQSPSRLHIGSIQISGELRDRGEGWNWFLDSTRVRYGFGEEQLRLSFSQRRNKLEWKIELEQPALFALPTDAMAGGVPLGLGGTYFAANRRQTNVASLFVSQGFIRFHGLAGNQDTLKLGRFGFSDGAEGTSQNSSLVWLRRQRISGRLIGNSNWTDATRSFDGVHFSDSFGKNNVTLIAARPTEGVFQTNGWSEVGVDIAYGGYTREVDTHGVAAEVRFFGLGYKDSRHVLKVDNRPLAARESDGRAIRIGTFGGDYVLVFPIRYLGSWDLLGWGAFQTGDWGVLHHHAGSAAAEIGWQPPIKWLHPWLRAGALYAGGDGDPNDRRHTTFFQPVPEVRQYERIPFYTLQNVEDYTGQLILRPSKRVELRSELHKVKLHSRNDLWYQGGGAFQDSSFGYSGTPSQAEGGLANFIDFSADIQASSHLHLRYYIGAISGKATLTSSLRGRKGGFTYLELGYRF